MNTKVGTITANATTVDVTFNPQSKCFYATIGEQTLSGSTWEELEKSVKRRLRQSAGDYAIHIVLLNDETRHYERALLRGKHARNNSYLVTFASGRKVAIESYTSRAEILCEGDQATDEQIAALNAKLDAMHAAERDVRAAKQPFVNSRITFSHLLDREMAKEKTDS